MTLKWKLILIGAGILFVVVCVYAYQHYADLQDRAAIQDDEKEIRETLEKADIAHVREEERLYRLLAEKEQKEQELCKKYADLEQKIKNIIIPSTPSALADAFRKHGYGSARVVIRNK